MPATITITDASGSRVLALSDEAVQALDSQRLTQTTINPATGTQTPQQSDWKNYLIANAIRMVLVPAAQQAAAALLTEAIPVPLTVTLPTIPALTHGAAMTAANVTATGGLGAGYQFSAAGLPSGVAINAATGQISGTPAAAGTYTYTVTVVDPLGNSVVASGTITVS
jgi:hypothetical protein